MPAAENSPEWIDTLSTPERQIMDLRGFAMPDILVLGRLHYSAATTPLANQCHRDWLVVVFVFTGQQTYLIDGAEVTVHGGEMLRILPGRTYSTGARPEQKGNLAWLILRTRGGAPDGNPTGAAGGIAGVITLLNQADVPMVLPVASSTRRMVDMAFAWWERRDSVLGREKIRNQIEGLVLAAAEHVANPEGVPPRQGNEQRIHRVVAWMGQNLHHPASAGDLAKLAGLSQAAFFTHFKRITGCSPKDYLLKLRVETAARQLRAHPEDTITKVAHAFGFSSSQYFATVFRRYLGMTPADHRRQ